MARTVRVGAESEALRRESHPLEPFLPRESRVLMLGSFPPKRNRWSMEFYYPNFQNDMWRIMGLLFFGDRDRFVLRDRKAFDELAIRDFCTEMGIALSDTAREVVRLRDNASDNFLEVVSPLDLEALLEALPRCEAIVATGQKAASTLASVAGCDEPGVGGFTSFGRGGRTLRFYRMPSTSRAFPRPLEQKAASYGDMFAELGLLKR